MPDRYQPTVDWLLDADSFVAKIETSADGQTLMLHNGLVRRTLGLQLGDQRTGTATISFDNLMTGESLLRAVRPEALLQVDGETVVVGGLVGQPNHAFLTEAWLSQMQSPAGAWQCAGYEIGTISERLEWARVRPHETRLSWPPKGKSVRFDYVAPDVQSENAQSEKDPVAHAGLRVSVHYEIYDGLPLISKWLSITNRGDGPMVLDRFTAEQLAIVEHSNPVEDRAGVPLPVPTVLHVETDQAFGGFNFEQANRHAVRWLPDPDFHTQVNYLKKMPCLLEVSPFRGPAQTLQPGDTFDTFRVFELVYDSDERERRGLALRRMYRVLAPWVTENPLMMHLRTADVAAVERAIEQCAAVGFEMLILSFGSGFNIENKDPNYVAQWTRLAELARQKGVEIGGYSLLSSRRIGNGHDVVSPEGESPAHGSCPALTSPWGLAYFETLRHFFEKTGFTLLEHDGSYPGDWDTTARPPLQKGLEDSQWAQWEVIREFYAWCRANGVYLNVPDYYYMAGSNKCGMGYREVNWSLPRAEQLIHTRQNIYDGTWTKAPSMGWMFVPLTEYHGGGAAATIEPLEQHLEHYRMMMLANLSAGVQACYRGPRLFDSPRTESMVREVVEWYKQHREILESDLIHLRRADGRDWDGWLHVNPKLPQQALLAVFNPLDEAIEREVLVPLYYAGLSETASVQLEGQATTSMELDRAARGRLRLTIPARGFRWVVFSRP